MGSRVPVLTATRTSEALNATWGEFDLEAKVWTIPAARMKARVEHRVPLSQRAMQIFHELKEPDPRAATTITFSSVNAKELRSRTWRC